MRYLYIDSKYTLKQSKRKIDRGEIGNYEGLCSILSKTDGLEVLITLYEWHCAPTSDDDCGCPLFIKQDCLMKQMNLH